MAYSTSARHKKPASDTKIFLTFGVASYVLVKPKRCITSSAEADSLMVFHPPFADSKRKEGYGKAKCNQKQGRPAQENNKKGAVNGFKMHIVRTESD